MNFIKEARKENKLTISELAMKMEMSISGYKKLEYGINKLTLARFIQLCDILNLDFAMTIKEVSKYV